MSEEQLETLMQWVEVMIDAKMTTNHGDMVYADRLRRRLLESAQQSASQDVKGEV